MDAERRKAGKEWTPPPAAAVVPPQPGWDRWSDRRSVRAAWGARIALGILLLAMFTAALGRLPLIDPDEGRYARIPQAMLQTGDFVTPRLDGVLYFEKPPLYYWLNAAAMAVLGPTEAANRVWNVFFGLTGLLLVFALARSVGGERAGLLAALLLGTSVLYVAASRFTIIDPTLTFFIVGALTSFWFAHRSRRREALWYWLATFAGCGLAVMAKGLIGVLIPGAVAALYLAVTRQLRVLARVPWLRGTLLFTAVTAPWFVLVSLRNPGFPWYFFVHEHLLRYTTNVASRGEPAWFFVVIAAAGLLPWTGAVLASAALLRGDARASHPEATLLVKFLWIWALAVLVFFSFSHSKLAAYILPALPPLATLGALAVDRTLDSSARLLRRLTAIGVVAGALATAAVGVGLCRALAGGLPHFPFSGALRSSDLVLAGAAAAVSVAALLLWLGGRARSGLTAAVAVALITWVLLLRTAAVAADSMSTKPVAAALTRAGATAGDVYAFYSYPQSLAFYLGYDLGVVEFHGELDYGIRHIPESLHRERFPSFAEFRSRWASDRRTFVVVPRQDVGRFRAEGLALGKVVYDGGWLVAMTNKQAP